MAVQFYSCILVQFCLTSQQLRSSLMSPEGFRLTVKLKPVFTIMKRFSTFSGDTDFRCFKGGRERVYRERMGEGKLKFQTEKQHPNRTSFENEFSWISNNFLICYAWIKLSLLGFFDIGERNKTLSNVTEIVLVCRVILHV